ncbi:MAG: DNA mismatch repair protein MutS, partial [Pseudomonadota bacterium]
MSRKRRLSPEDEALWRKSVRDVAPLKKDPVKTVAPSAPGNAHSPLRTGPPVRAGAAAPRALQ